RPALAAGGLSLRPAPPPSDCGPGAPGPGRRGGRIELTTRTAATGSGRAPRASRRAPAAPDAGPRPDLRILETRILRGPNYWAREPVIRSLVDLGSLEDYPSNTIPGFVDRLVDLMPSLED